MLIVEWSNGKALITILCYYFSSSFFSFWEVKSNIYLKVVDNSFVFRGKHDWAQLYNGTSLHLGQELSSIYEKLEINIKLLTAP